MMDEVRGYQKQDRSMAALLASCFVVSFRLIAKGLNKSVSSLPAMSWVHSDFCCQRAFQLSRNAPWRKPFQNGWFNGSVVPSHCGTSPITAPLTTTEFFQQFVRSAYQMISGLAEVNIPNSPGTVPSSRCAQFTGHRWFPAAPPRSGINRLRYGQACAYIVRIF
jgi:hypothetical protein